MHGKLLHCISTCTLGQDRAISQVLEMGFDLHAARSALESTLFDVDKAVDLLLEQVRACTTVIQQAVS